MATTAEEYKNIANDQFKNNQFDAAIDNYSNAIELDPNQPIYFSNRSFCYLKLEKYGSALEDAESAIKLDSHYIKGYYRRGTAFMYLRNYKKAISDFQHIIKINPSDKQTLKVLEFCQKTIYQINFAKAISINEEKLLDLVDVTKFIYKPDPSENYSGPMLDCIDESQITSIQNSQNLTADQIDQYCDMFQINPSFISNLIQHYHLKRNLPKHIVIAIIKKASIYFKNLKTLVRMSRAEGGQINVCGDIHGQFIDLCQIFKMNGEPSKKNKYIFNGDIVDRGAYSVECIILLLSYMLCYPNCLYINRGNHESLDLNRVFGFEKETNEKYSPYIFKLFTEMFIQMPICCLIENRILVMHGGLPRKHGVKLKDIEKVNRFVNDISSNELIVDLLWADPQNQPGWAPSQRGVCFVFGPDVTKQFCRDNKLDYIIRSHEVKQQGYEIAHDSKCVTIFSAPNYCNMNNKGALIVLNDDSLKPKFRLIQQ